MVVQDRFALTKNRLSLELEIPTRMASLHEFAYHRGKCNIYVREKVASGVKTRLT